MLAEVGCSGQRPHAPGLRLAGGSSCWRLGAYTKGALPVPEHGALLDCWLLRFSTCTYDSILNAEVFQVKHFILASPSDIISRTASWNSMQVSITKESEWSPEMWQTFTATERSVSQFPYPTQIAIYAWLATFALIAVLAGITLQPLFWESKQPTACACDLITTPASAETQPCSRNAEDEVLGGLTSFADSNSNAADAQSECDDENDFIDPDSGSEYEDDGVSDNDSESEYASDIESEFDGSEHEGNLVPAMVMVRPSHVFRAVRTMVYELERRAGHA